MNFIRDFINMYGATILQTILTAIAGYLGIAVKNIYNKYINDKTKKDIARTCVRAVEQIYKDLHGHEKLDKCIESISEMLNEKGIKVTDIEMRMLIEAAVNEFNNNFNNTENTEEKVGE